MPNLQFFMLPHEIAELVEQILNEKYFKLAVVSGKEVVLENKIDVEILQRQTAECYFIPRDHEISMIKNADWDIGKYGWVRIYDFPKWEKKNNIDVLGLTTLDTKSSYLDTVQGRSIKCAAAVSNFNKIKRRILKGLRYYVVARNTDRPDAIYEYRDILASEGVYDAVDKEWRLVQGAKYKVEFKIEGPIPQR